jgi:hypothetical protein
MRHERDTATPSPCWVIASWINCRHHRPHGVSAANAGDLTNSEQSGITASCDRRNLLPAVTAGQTVGWVLHRMNGGNTPRVPHKFR